MGTLSDAARALPPLLKLLELNSRSAEHTAASRDPGLPVDADALEIAAQVRETLRVWAGQVRSVFHADDLPNTFAAWYEEFLRWWMRGAVPESKLLDATIVVESWVRMIRNKYDPPKMVEWKSPCPKCGVAVEHYDSNRRKVGEFFSSITVNVSTQTAECSACGERFDGAQGIALLRLLTNVGEQLTAGTTVDKGALSIYMQYRGVSEVA
jgi:hypothetical protein